MTFIREWTEGQLIRKRYAAWVRICYRSVTVPRLAEQKTNADGRYGTITSAMINAFGAAAPVFDNVKSSYKVGAMHE